MKRADRFLAEYIWLDGAAPTQGLRSKTRVVERGTDAPDAADLPVWSYDGSSTYQATGGDSDLILPPVRVVPDPLRGRGAVLVLCEVLDAEGVPHETNQRATLRDALERTGAGVDPWVGFEQEYTLFRDGRPLGWPRDGYPAPQGPFYCGVGADAVFGRTLVDRHAAACLAAGLLLYGTNAEVMPAPWEFQIGHRGFDGESGDPLTVSDHLWLARFLLSRVCEEEGVSVSLHPKPVKGDWNGAGAHTNFSTAATRDPANGIAAIREAIARLQVRHRRHIAHYGDALHERLTGLHETCAIDIFRSGVADRGASVRVPRQVLAAGHGYLEDRRPGANCDPYVVCRELITTICAATDGPHALRRSA